MALFGLVSHRPLQVPSSSPPTGLCTNRPICIHAYVCTDLCAYTPMYVHAYVSTSLQAYVPMCLYAYMPMYVQTYVRTCLCVYKPRSLQAYVPMYLQAYVPTCLHTYEAAFRVRLSQLRGASTTYFAQFVFRVCLGGASEASPT